MFSMEIVSIEIKERVGLMYKKELGGGERGYFIIWMERIGFEMKEKSDWVIEY